MGEKVGNHFKPDVKQFCLCHVQAVPKKIKENVISTMNPEEIPFKAKHNNMIIETAAQFFHAIHLTSQNYQYISCKMRKEASLLREIKIDPTVKSLEDVFMQGNSDVVKAVKTLAGYAEDTGPYKTPSLARKLGHCLKRCSKILQI